MLLFVEKLNVILRSVCEHLGISVFIGKRVKGDDDSAIKEYFSFCNQAIDFEDFSILTTSNINFKVH